MPKCTAERMEFGRVGRRVIEADFTGGAIGSDGGVPLLRQVDDKIGLSRAVAEALRDRRDPRRISHSLETLVAQRLYGLCCGYEDLNDHDRLRHDLLFQTAVDKVKALASSPTLSRLETGVEREDVVALNRVLLEQFMASFPQPPEELILDFDASDVPLHGAQELAQFHGYYDHYCYLPLYVFCGKALLAVVLRPGRSDGALHAAAVLKLMVTRLRQAWPGVRIIFRGDSGFCRQRLIRWCERHEVGHVIGMARNARLHQRVAAWEEAMKQAWQKTGEKQRDIREFHYAADSWNRSRRLVTRLEYGDKGPNPRFVVTNLDLSPDTLYDRLYCARGEAENRIKETQLDLFGTRANAHSFLANWLRLLLAGLAYTLDAALQGVGPDGDRTGQSHPRHHPLQALEDRGPGDS